MGSVPADEVDDDGDGYVECDPWYGENPDTFGGDCDDIDPGVNPGEQENLNDGIDSNCGPSECPGGCVPLGSFCDNCFVSSLK